MLIYHSERDGRPWWTYAVFALGLVVMVALMIRRPQEDLLDAALRSTPLQSLLTGIYVLKPRRKAQTPPATS